MLCLLILQQCGIRNIKTQTEILTKEKAYSIQIIKGPYLQNVQRKAITIMWETDREAASQVIYRKGVSYKEKVVCNRLNKIHEITINELEEETKYHYKVTSGIPEVGAKVTSKEATFKTAVKGESPFCFAIYGDNRTYSEVHERITNAIAEKRPDIVLNTGDVVHSGRLYEGWGREFFEPAKELFKNTPFYIAIGNHEGDSHWFYDFVSYPEPENYYSFDYGNAHLTVIDSTRDYQPGTTQYKWLEEDLKSAGNTWKFVLFHHPPYSSFPGYSGRGTEDKKRRVLCAAFERYNVDVVFNGHVHSYERTYPLLNNRVEKLEYRDSAVIYIVTGGGGAELDNLKKNKSYFTAESAMLYHYCFVRIDGKNFEMVVYDIDGNPIDFLAISK